MKGLGSSTCEKSQDRARLPNVKSGTSIVQLPVFFIHCGKLHGTGAQESGCAPAFPLAAIGLPGGDAEKELLAQSTLLVREHC